MAICMKKFMWFCMNLVSRIICSVVVFILIMSTLFVSFYVTQNINSKLVEVNELITSISIE